MLNNNDIKLILKSIDKSINVLKKKGKKFEDLINDYIEIKNKLIKNTIKKEVAREKKVYFMKYIDEGKNVL